MLNTALILLADHDLAISTMAARVAASARAHPYAVVSAGLGAIEGQKHGTATTLAHRFLQQASSDPMGAIAEKLRSGHPIPGFGHYVYKLRDPRADHLLAILRSAATWWPTRSSPRSPRRSRTSTWRWRSSA